MIALDPLGKPKTRRGPNPHPLENGWAELIERYPDLAELAAKVSAATPPRGWRFWWHRRRLREALAEIINPAEAWEEYSHAWQGLLQQWEKP